VNLATSPGSILWPTNAGEAWTAISAVVTAITVIVAILTAKRWFDPRPQLEIDWERINAFHDWHRNAGGDRYETFWLRLPIRNQGRGDANNVEVSVESITIVTDPESPDSRRIIPFRLVWTNTNEPRAFIPNGSGLRLVEIGSATNEEGKLILRGDLRAGPIQLSWLQLFNNSRALVGLTVTAENARPMKVGIIINVGRKFASLEAERNASPDEVRVLPLPSTMAESEPFATIQRVDSDGII